MELLKRYEFDIMMSQVDDRGNCRLSTLGSMLIHSACLHAEYLGVGAEMLHKKNMAWVLTNLSVDVFEMPRFLDKIFIETWMEGRSHSIVSRNYIIYDSNNTIIGGAASYWTVIDFKKRAVIDFKSLPLDAFSRDVKSIIGKPKRFKPSKDIEVLQKEVVYSDIDINRHMYSLKYVEHVLDSIPAEEMSLLKLSHFDISYVHEIVLGAKYSIFRSAKDKVFSIYTDDDKVVAIVGLA